MSCPTNRYKTRSGGKHTAPYYQLSRNILNKQDLMSQFLWRCPLSFPGQVLGCNYSGDDPTVGHYIFLGSGDFHPIGLVLHTGKPLAMLDPYTGEAKEMGKDRIERILRQRSGLIMSSMDKNRFGILIGAKPGQMRRNLALRMKRKLEKHGKKGFLEWSMWVRID